MDREVYTVMADCGIGGFLWHKPDDSPFPFAGSNVYSLMEKGIDDPLMSKSLFLELCNWAQSYMNGFSKNVLESPEIDWKEFNNEGMRLARLLKKEFGSGVKVVYAKAYEDPTKNENRFQEIKEDIG